MKQTAVEWLLEQIKNSSRKTDLVNKEGLFFYRILQQAKEMENERMIDFADKYGTYLLQGGTMSATTYKETFKSEQNVIAYNALQLGEVNDLIK